MDWLLRRLRPGNRGPSALVCYLGENGPIAYGADLFSVDPRERAEALLSTHLSWFWRTSNPNGAVRDWTQLSRWSLAALLEDLASARRHVLILGIDDAARGPGEEMTDARVAGWIRDFGAAGDGPLHAVVNTQAPAGDLLFVAQHPPESIRILLHVWGISRDRADRKAYARLHGHALEDVVRSLTPERHS